jgi:hypothetical protein
MLVFPVGAAEVVPIIDSAQRIVLIQSASVSAPPVLERLRSARARKVKVNALLGPKPAVEIVDGKPMIGTRPYALHAGAELAALNGMGVEYLINPEFNELQATTFEPGTASHATYIIADGKKAMVCSGALSATALKHERNVCVRSDEVALVKALTALFYSEFDESLNQARKREFDRVARSRLVVCPSCEDALLAELAEVDELTIRVAGFGSLPKIEAHLLQLGSRLRVLLPLTYRGRHPFEETMRRAGAQIRFVAEPFDGLVWFSRSKAGAVRAFVGSMQLHANSMGSSREVGVRLDGAPAMEVEQMFAKLWSSIAGITKDR